MSKLFQTARENLSFLGVCVIIVVSVFAVAYFIQKLLLKENVKKVSNARYIAYIGMFSAVSGVLMTLELPLFFAPNFYKLDFSEIPVLICGFYLGPVAGVVSEFLKIVVKLLIKGTSTAFVGDFANFCVGCALILPATIIYHIKKTKKTAVIAMASGTAVMTVFGSYLNAVYMLPTFSALFGIPLDVIIGMGTAVNSSINSVSTLVLFAVVPFNLLKGIVVSLMTYLLYKRIESVLFRQPKNRSARQSL